MTSWRAYKERQMDDLFPARKPLRDGQSLHLWCGRGDTIVAVQRTVKISSAPAWLGEHMLRAEFHVPEGEAYVVRQAGWLVIFAPNDAEVACIAHQSRIRTLLDRANVVFRHWWSHSSEGWGRQARRKPEQ
jgi:hypothetical protein